MLDRPDAAELLEALAAFLDDKVVPAFDGGRRFHALVAANVARIVAREFRLGDELSEDEIDDLRNLLEMKEAGEAPTRKEELFNLTRELCTRIETGAMDDAPSRTRVLAYLKRSLTRRLQIDNPKYPR